MSVRLGAVVALVVTVVVTGVLVAPEPVPVTHVTSHHLHDGPGATSMALAKLAMKDNDERIYDSTNTDGQAGSGGRAITYRPKAGIVRSGATRRAFDARLFRTGFGGWEPTMGVHENGTLYFAARNNNADPVFIVSKDDGVTWDPASPPHEASVDPYMWFDSDTGRVFVSDIDPTISCTPTSFSDDDGTTWTTTRICGHIDHQTIFGGPAPQDGEQPEGYRNVVYYCAINGGLGEYSSATTCSKTLDGGSSWSVTGDPAFVTDPINEDEGVFCDGATGHGIVDDRGTIYLPKGLCGIPVLGVSRDEGATWEVVQIAEAPEFPVDHGNLVTAHESSLAIDDAGNLFYVWPGKDLHVYLSVSRDGARSWSRPVDVTPPGVTRAALPVIDAGQRGRIAVAFAATADARKTPVEETTWDGYVVTSADALAVDPLLYGGPINNPDTNPLWKGSCSVIRCGNLGDFFDVAIDEEGSAWAAFVDSCPGKKNVCTAFGVTDPRGEAIVGHTVGGIRLR